MAFEALAAPPIAGLLNPAVRNDGGHTHRQLLNKLLTQPCPVRFRAHRGGDLTERDGREVYVVDVPWSARLAFEQWALGWAVAARAPGSGLVTGFLNREIPWQHPEKPSYYASRCRLVEGVGACVLSQTSFPIDGRGAILPDALGRPLGPSPAPAYADNQGVGHADGLARYEVEFTPPKYQVRTDAELAALYGGVPPAGAEVGRYVECRQTWSVQAVPVLNVLRGAAKQLKFVADGVQVPEAGLLLMPQAQVELTWRMTTQTGSACVSRALPGGLTTYLGLVNSVPFGGTSNVPFFLPETLLLQAAPDERVESPTFRPLFDVRFTFSYRPQGWNVFPRADGTYGRATLGGAAGDPTVFKTADLTGLFIVLGDQTFQ